MQAPLPILLSVVVPLSDAGDRAANYLRQIVACVADLVSDFEIIVVDNSSDSALVPDYDALVAADGLPNLQIYRLLHKVDFDVAAWAGVENSLGDYVLVFDPLNENLSFLSRALEQAIKGNDIVFVQNVAPAVSQRGLVEAFFAKAFHRTFRWLSGVDLVSQSPPCRLIAKRVISVLLQQPKPAVRYRSLQGASGFNKATLQYSAPRSGTVNEGLRSRVRRSMSLLMSSTTAPLRLVSGIALLGATLNLVYSVYVLLIALVRGNVAPGWTTLSLQQSGMFFLLSIVVFFLSEYLAHAMSLSLAGPPYYIASERTSAVITRRQKLNVEAAQMSVATTLRRDAAAPVRGVREDVA
jgi:hypothetical protein